MTHRIANEEWRANEHMRESIRTRMRLLANLMEQAREIGNDQFLKILGADPGVLDAEIETLRALSKLNPDRIRDLAKNDTFVGNAAAFGNLGVVSERELASLQANSHR